MSIFAVLILNVSNSLDEIIIIGVYLKLKIISVCPRVSDAVSFAAKRLIMQAVSELIEL